MRKFVIRRNPLWPLLPLLGCPRQVHIQTTVLTTQIVILALREQSIFFVDALPLYPQLGQNRLEAFLLAFLLNRTYRYRT